MIKASSVRIQTWQLLRKWNKYHCLHTCKQLRVACGCAKILQGSNRLRRNKTQSLQKQLNNYKNYKLCLIENLFMKVSDVLLQIALQFGSAGAEWTLELRPSSTLFSLMSYERGLPSVLFTTCITLKICKARCGLTNTISQNTTMFGLPMVMYFPV
jgi:hypothetical protein